MDTLLAVFLPELRTLSAADRAGALRSARAIPYDAFELLGMAVGLIVAALFLAHALDAAMGTGARVLAACPVAAVTIGPFALRRTRRGLREVANRA